jgi:beta-phosphoglucomutase-like phosphatase (HAD superfamily)
MQIKAAVFDVDGILFDTETMQWEGWVEVLKPLGVSLSKEKYREYAGKRGDLIAKDIVRDFGLDVDSEKLAEEKKDIIEKWTGERDLILIPYAREAVEFFIKAGLPVAVCGGAPRPEVELKLRRYGLIDLFKVIVAGSDVKNGKPNPDMYLLAAERLGIRPENCLAFEDTEYGLASATSAGMSCITMPNEFSQHQDFSKADAVVKNLKEAIEFVKNKYNL